MPHVAGHALDWSVMQDEDIQSVVTAMSKRGDSFITPLYDADDLEQEAWMILATRSAEARKELAGGPSHLASWLRRRLLDISRTELRRQERTQPLYDLRDEGADV